jgi:hypothetical protein
MVYVEPYVGLDVFVYDGCLGLEVVERWPIVADGTVIPVLPEEDVRLLVLLDEHQHALQLDPQAWATTTASGKQVWYAEPWRTEIDVTDILTALRRVKRYCGAIDVSVLQHTCICIRLSETKRLRELMAVHDMSEAYIPDLPSPLKHMLPEYKVVEELWSRHIHRSLGVQWPDDDEKRQMKVHDEAAALIEMKAWGMTPHHDDRQLTNREHMVGAASFDPRAGLERSVMLCLP